MDRSKKILFTILICFVLGVASILIPQNVEARHPVEEITILHCYDQHGNLISVGSGCIDGEDYCEPNPPCV